MKKIQSLLFIASILLVQFASAQAPAKLTVYFSFTGIEEGYDHLNYSEVWIDGVKAGESSKQKESKPNKFTVTTTQGQHQVEVKNFAQYEGVWEEHTIANNYSIDCSYSQLTTLKKKNKLKLLFDIDAGTIVK